MKQAMIITPHLVICLFPDFCVGNIGSVGLTFDDFMAAMAKAGFVRELPVVS